MTNTDAPSPAVVEIIAAARARAAASVETALDLGLLPGVVLR